MRSLYEKDGEVNMHRQHLGAFSLHEGTQKTGGGERSAKKCTLTMQHAAAGKAEVSVT
jgi:hypothetical protein